MVKTHSNHPADLVHQEFYPQLVEYVLLTLLSGLMACSDSTALLGCSDALGEYFILQSLSVIAEYMWR